MCLIVKAKFFTKLAEKKIKEKGGACLDGHPPSVSSSLIRRTAARGRGSRRCGARARAARARARAGCWRSGGVHGGCVAARGRDHCDDSFIRARDG